MKLFSLKYSILCFLFIYGCTEKVDFNKETDETSSHDWINRTLKEFKKNEKVKGLAFAIFDSTYVINELYLGKSTYNSPIDKHTLFSIQSISKNITALAVLLAVQDSLLALDQPISKYVADFEVQSCFESNPEQKITLEMLLSHTAGFTHEAPVGNNFDYDACSFSEHLNSINRTWLKFPVGTNYAYSNLGFDLAAHIIEQVTGQEFNSYLSKKVFTPLGMEQTTINDSDVVKSKNKTEGIIQFTKNRHLKIPLIGSGAVYTNVHDFTKYVQFLMRHGKTEKTVIDDQLLVNMYTIRRNNYGLGTYIGLNDGNYFINHNGGGYGYSATFIWFVEYNLGAVLLCNTPSNTYNATETILKEYIKDTNHKKATSLSKSIREVNANYLKNPEAHNEARQNFCTNDTLYKDRWRKYIGKYALVYSGMDPKWYTKLALALGYHPQKLYIYRENQVLKIKSPDGKSMLREYKEGIFFTSNGEVVNLKSEIPTYRNIKLEKIYNGRKR